MTCIDYSYVFGYDHSIDKICSCFKNGCCRVDNAAS
nr:MAG TPA: hypothetical protein [Bacteriophage sp.]